MPILDSQGNWINRNGNPTPKKNVPSHMKKRDAVVTRIMRRARKLQQHMKREKLRIQNDIEKFNSSISEGAEPIGNLQLSDYANLNLVKITQAEVIRFDERLNVAKSIMDKCLRKWTTRSSQNLKAIITDAFNVDKKGNINKYMVFRLLQIEIDDADWKRATALIRESIQVEGTRKYLQFLTRSSKDDEYESLNLNFSSL